MRYVMGYAMGYPIGYTIGYTICYAMGYAMAYVNGWRVPIPGKGVVPTFPESFPARSVSVACPLVWVSICMEGEIFRRRSSGRGGVAAKDTSCMHGAKENKECRLLSVTRIKKAFASRGIYIPSFFPRPLYLKFAQEFCAAHRRSLLQQEQAKDPARASVHEKSDTVRSRKSKCQSPPDNPETGDTYHKRWKKLRWPENRPPTRIQVAQSPPSRQHHDYFPHDNKQHNYWVELVRVCRLAVVVAAAACCSNCDSENSHPPNEARAIRCEGRRAISANPAGRQGSTYNMSVYLRAAWMGSINE